MTRQDIQNIALVFFVSLGIGYSGSAIGAEPGDDDPNQGVEVSAFDTVSLNVNGAPLREVIQLLSIQSQRNIIPSPEVQGTVVANLYDVTFEEALDAILQQNGAGYVEKGNFIYIYTTAELEEIEQAERKPVHRVLELNYMTAEDASTFVQPLLSSAGSISISGNVAPGFQPTVSDGGADSSAHAHRMVVRDYEENVEEIAGVIGELDVPPMQVLVEATILKADVTENLAFGVDFSILSDIAVDAFSNPLSGVNELLSGDVQPTNTSSVINSTVGNTAGEGGLKVGVVTNNVATFVRALDSVTDTTVVANPKLLALNRQRANVLIGEKIGYLSTTATSTATTQTVEFLDTGTQLTVRPFASPDGMIRLEIKPAVSSARIREVIPGTTSAAVTIPDEITQELTTNVMVRDGQTVVLGGLFKEETTITRNQVPGLGSLPIAGAAFQGRDDTMTRSEVIFLITPRIVKDSPLYESGASAKDDVERARIGAREHLLPWSRSKLSAAHLREALEALEAGDRDKALWEVDLALGLDPKQVEAIRLKEKLTGQRTYFPDRSLLDDAVGVMIEKQTGQRTPPHRQTPMKPNPTPTKQFGETEPASRGAAEESIDRQHNDAEFMNDASLRRLGYPPLNDGQGDTDADVPEGQSELPRSKPVRVETVESDSRRMAEPVSVDLDDDADWDQPMDVAPPAEDEPLEPDAAATTPASSRDGNTTASDANGGESDSTTQAIDALVNQAEPVEQPDAADNAPEAAADATDEPTTADTEPAASETTGAATEAAADDTAADEDTSAALLAPLEAEAEQADTEAGDTAASTDAQAESVRDSSAAAVRALLQRLEDSPFAATDVPADEADEAEAPAAETAETDDQPSDDATANVPVK